MSKEWKPAHPIHVANTVDKWCKHCGRKMDKKLATSKVYDGDTGQKIEYHYIEYTCPREPYFLSSWEHESYRKLYQDVEVA
jgi:hypothetical protein